MGDRIALDEVALDLARNDEGEMQQAMVEYLEKRQANVEARPRRADRITRR